MATTYKGLTIKFGGDTTQLTKALSDVQKASRDTQSDLRQINASLKFNPGNTELLEQKVRKLNDAYSQTKSKLETYRQAQAELDAKRQQGITLTAQEQNQYDKLTRDILKCQNQMDGYGKAIKSATSAANSSGTPLAKLGATIEENSSKIEKAGKGMETAGKAMVGAFGGASVASVAAFKDVDAGLDVITKKTGATGEALDEMKGIASDLAQEIPVEFGTAGAAVGEVNTRFNLTGDALEDLSAKYLKFAKLNDIDVTTAIDKSQKAMAAFGVPTSQAGVFLDTLNRVGQNTGVSMDTLSSSMVTNSATLHDLGMNASDAAIFIGNLEKSGVDSTTALAGFKKAMVNAAKEGKTTGEVLGELKQRIDSASTSQEGINAASEVFGTRAAPAMYEALKSGQITFDQLGSSMSDFGGSIDRTFEDVEDPAGKFETIMNSLKLTGYELGGSLLETLSPALKDVADGAKSVSEWFKNLSPEQQELISKVMVIGTAIGGVVLVGGKLMTFFSALGPTIQTASAIFGTFSAVLAANPIVLVAMAVAALVAGLVWFFTQTELGKELWGQFTGFLQDAWTAVSTFFTGAWAKFSQGWTDFWNGVGAFVKFIWENSVLGMIVNNWGQISDFFSGAWATFSQGWSDFWGGVGQKAGDAAEGIKTTMSDKFNAARDATGSAFEGVKSLMSGDLDGAQAHAENAVTSILDFMGFHGMGEQVHNAFEIAKNSIIDKMRKAQDFVRSVPDNIVGFFRDIPQKISDIFASIGIHFPHIDLPHIQWHWNQVGPVSVPAFDGIEWYAKAMDNGMVLNSPTIFGSQDGKLLGAGDAGSETVVGTSSLMSMIQRAVSNAASASVNLTVNVSARVNGNVDAYELGQQIGRGANNVLKMRGQAV